MPVDSPKVAAVLDDDSSVDSSSDVKMSESEVGFLPDQTNFKDDNNCYHDSVVPNIIDPDFPSSPVIA